MKTLQQIDNDSLKIFKSLFGLSKNATLVILGPKGEAVYNSQSYVLECPFTVGLSDFQVNGLHLKELCYSMGLKINEMLLDIAKMYTVEKSISMVNRQLLYPDGNVSLIGDIANFMYVKNSIMNESDNRNIGISMDDAFTHIKDDSEDKNLYYLKGSHTIFLKIKIEKHKHFNVNYSRLNFKFFLDFSNLKFYRI